MFTFITPKQEVSLSTLFNFDITKAINPKNVSPQTSLTLGSSFGRRLQSTLFLTKQEHHIENVNTEMMVKSAARELEEKIKLDRPSISIENALTYPVSESLQIKEGKDQVVTLRNQYTFLRLTSETKKLDIKNSIFHLQTKGLTPVLVFPEKSDYFIGKQTASLLKLSQLNCLFQCDLLALVGLYGNQAKNQAIYLLENRLISFFGLELKSVGHLNGINTLRLPKKIANLVEKELWVNT